MILAFNMMGQIDTIQIFDSMAEDKTKRVDLVFSENIYL